MGKGAGVIAYTSEGDVLIVWENVFFWSFPKGHRIGKESYIKNAEREFREETNFPKNIKLNLTEDRKIRIGDVHLYFYEMSLKDKDKVSADGDEVISLMWIPINQLENFSKTNRVNKTISRLDIKLFKQKTGLDKLDIQEEDYEDEDYEDEDYEDEDYEDYVKKDYQEEKQPQQNKSSKPLNAFAKAFVPTFTNMKSSYAFNTKKSKKRISKKRKSRSKRSVKR